MRIVGANDGERPALINQVIEVRALRHASVRSCSAAL